MTQLLGLRYFQHPPLLSVLILLNLQIELLLPESFKRKHNQKTKVFYPNKKYRPFRTLFPSLGFRTLGFNGEDVKAALDTTVSLGHQDHRQAL